MAARKSKQAAVVAPVEAPKGKKKKSNASDETAAVDTMSQCVTLCQEQKWREALLLLRRMCEKAQKEGNADLYVSLSGAQQKIEYSLRRQMAASLVKAAGQLLSKEYLLDVGQ